MKKSFLIIAILMLLVAHFANAQNYLKFTSAKNGSTINFKNLPTSVNIYYLREEPTETSEWIKAKKDEITLNNGEFIYFKGEENNTLMPSSTPTKFGIVGEIYASGSVMSLLDENNDGIVLEGTQTFRSLFEGCEGLYSAPELPATTLKSSCYRDMFKDCTNLTIAPELPATELDQHSYQGMFYGCTNLKYIKVNFTKWSAKNDALTDWVSGVSQDGTFICPEELLENEENIIYDSNHIPFDEDYPWMINQCKIISIEGHATASYNWEESDVDIIENVTNINIGIDIVITPENGYEITNAKYFTKQNTEGIEIIETDGIYSFKMPNCHITKLEVTATNKCTTIKSIDAETYQKPEKILIDGRIYIKRNNKLFDLNGRNVIY